MIKKLNIKITLPDALKVPCGELFYTSPDSRGKIEGTFRYTQAYLDHPQAIPVDPVHLPLIDKEFNADRPEGIHGVFEDSLPDDWGRRILKHRWGRKIDPDLLGLMGSGLGALSFSDEKPKPVQITDLTEVAESAFEFYAGRPVNDDRLAQLYSAGCPAGGARPKVLVADQESGQWIAKIPQFDDNFQIESIEGATLKLAQDAGLDVPEFKILPAGKHKVILLKRFDVCQGDTEGRNHMISMKTILGAEGFDYSSYADMFTAIKKWSCQPQDDTNALFRQMVFNLAIGNTDDHLKNFCMIHTVKGLHLSPAYDLLPNVNNRQTHQLSLPKGVSHIPNKTLLLKMGTVCRVLNAEQIIDDVLGAVAQWQTTFSDYDVPEKDIQKTL